MKKLLKRFVNKVMGLVNLTIVSITSGKIGGRDLKHDLPLLVSRESPVCLDIGANLGQTIDMFSSIFKRPVIHAFEPSTRIFKELESIYKGKPIYLYKTGVGAESGELVFNNMQESTLSSFLEFSDLAKKNSSFVAESIIRCSQGKGCCCHR